MDLYLPIAEMPINVLTVLAVSAAVGFVSGMFGIGGGFMMTLLLIFMGVPPAIAPLAPAPLRSAATAAVSPTRSSPLHVPRHSCPTGTRGPCSHRPWFC